jgi:hypothetical protein
MVMYNVLSVNGTILKVGLVVYMFHLLHGHKK